MHRRPEASVVVVHHRGLEHLLEALAALEAAAARGPDARDPPRGQRLRRAPGRDPPPASRRCAGSPSARNVGFAAGCRLGVEAARAPIVALRQRRRGGRCPDAPRLLVAALCRRPPPTSSRSGGRLTDRTGAAQRLLGRLPDLRRPRLRGRRRAGRSSRCPRRGPGEERLFACGGLMAVRRDEFLDSGGFDDDYFAYLEDVDFGWRQWIFGRRIVAEPRAVARHRGGATGEALGVFSRGFLFEKNAFATVYKNFDARALPRPDAGGPDGVPRRAWRRCWRRATPAPRSSSAIRTPAPAAPLARSAALRASPRTSRPRVSRRRSADDRPPARPALDPPPPRARWPRSGAAVQAAAAPLGRRDLREVSAAARADVPGRRAVRRRDFFAPFLAERARRSSRTTLDEIFEARRVSFSVVIPTYRRPETLFPVLDALGAPGRRRPSSRSSSWTTAPATTRRRGSAAYRPPYPFRFFSQENGGPAVGAQPRRARGARRGSCSSSATTPCPSRRLLAVHGRAHAEPRPVSGRGARLHDVAAGPAGLALSPPHQRVRPAVRLRADRATPSRCRSTSSTRRTSRCRASSCSTPASSTRASRTPRGRTSRSRTG